MRKKAVVVTTLLSLTLVGASLTIRWMANSGRSEVEPELIRSAKLNESKQRSCRFYVYPNSQDPEDIDPDDYPEEMLQFRDSDSVIVMAKIADQNPDMLPTFLSIGDESENRDNFVNAPDLLPGEHYWQSHIIQYGAEGDQNRMLVYCHAGFDEIDENAVTIRSTFKVSLAELWNVPPGGQPQVLERIRILETDPNGRYFIGFDGLKTTQESPARELP